MIRAGELRERISFQRWQSTDDPRWGIGGSWETIGPDWASVIPVGGAEPVVDKGVQTDVTHKLVIRFRPDVTSKMRVRWRQRTLDIVSVTDPDGRRRELHLLAREYVDA